MARGTLKGVAIVPAVAYVVNALFWLLGHRSEIAKGFNLVVPSLRARGGQALAAAASGIHSTPLGVRSISSCRSRFRSTRCLAVPDVASTSAVARVRQMVRYPTWEVEEMEDWEREEYLHKERDALESLLVEAVAGDAEAKYEAAQAFLHWSCVPKDMAMVAHWLGQAAEQGHAQAQYELGMLFMSGDGVDEDPATAAAWVSAAANQGLHVAQIQMGTMLLGGIGVAANGEWARYWFERAAESDTALGGEAEYQLACMFESGLGVEANARAALMYYGRASGRGHKQAIGAYQTMRRLGTGYCEPGNTPGLPRRVRKALWGNPL